jgi:holo-[acyl-carrier protein] synthase
MILGLGLDIARVDRIEDNIARFGERFLDKVCTPLERAEARKYTHQKALANHVAGRIAAKEAACKALGTGFTQGVSWKCFEVAREPGGRPTLRATGAAAQRMSESGVKNVLLSISHDGGVAAAVVVLEGE